MSAAAVAWRVGCARFNSVNRNKRSLTLDLSTETGQRVFSVLTPWTVFDNPQLQERGFFEKICHPEAGTHLYAGIPWKMSRTPGRVRMPPPCLGEHNEKILEALAGLSPQEIERLTEAGITGRTPPRT